MPDSTQNQDMLASIEAIVQSARARRQRDRLVVGTSWTLVIVPGTMLALATLDMLTPLEVPMRMAAAAALLITGAAAIAYGVARPLVRPEPTSRVAHLIERTIAGMHNRLITALDLRRAGDAEAKLADPFVQRLLEQTRQRLSTFTPAMVSERAPLKQSLTALAVTIVLGVTLLAVARDRLTTAIERLIKPTADIAPVSSIAFDVVPRDTQVLEGDSVTLAARFTRGNDPHMSVRIKPASGAWTSYPLEVGTDGQPAFTLSAVNEPAQYQIVGGGTWSPVYNIGVIRRPRIEGVTASVRLPDYMAIPEPRMIEGDLSVISAPLGSTLEVNAIVAGHAARGVAKTFKASTLQVKEKAEQELVWIEDSLPADAESIGSWRWVNDSPHSGTRAFTFDWARRPFGFRTRLSALPIGAGASLFVYTFIDPVDVPGRITLTTAIGNRSYALLFTNPARAADPAWRAAQAAKPAVPNTVVIDMGPMPPAGRWSRITVPIEKIIGAAPAAPVEVAGLNFDSDSGRVVFDRVGAVQSLTREVTQTKLEPLASFELRPASASRQPATMPNVAASSTNTNNWVVSLPVDKDYQLNLEFFTEKGDASPAILPMNVVTTVDASPTLVLEKPTQNITLAQPQPVPVMLRVFDDYGIADVGVQTGKSPTDLEPIRWFKTYTGSTTSDLVLTSLDPTGLKISPGAAITFQFVVRDRKGQIATSLPLRLAIASPAEAAGAAVDKGSAPLVPLFDALQKLLATQAKLTGAAAGLVDAFDPKREVATTQSSVVSATQPALPGEVNADALAKLASKKESQKQQEDLVAKTAAQTEAERQAMIKQLDAAALAAQKSASALPGEAQVLAAMSAQLQQAAREQQAMASAALAAAKIAEKLTEKQQAENPELEKAVAERLAKLAELTDEQKKEAEALREQLQQLEAARKDMATDPQASQDRMQALQTEQRAQQATEQLASLDETLDAKRQELEELRAQIAELKKQTAAAQSGQELRDLAQKTAETEKQAMEEMAELKDLMRDEQAGANAEEQQDDMPAPWDPPGQEFEATPVERDTPAKNDPNKKTTDEEKKQLAEKEKNKAKEDEENWDEVPELPQIGARTKEDERYKDKEQRADVVDDQQNANEPAPTDTKRKRLEKNQGKFEQALTAAAKKAQASQNKVDQMQSEVNSAMEQMSEQAQSSPSQAAKTAQQLQKMMNSDAMRSAMAAARRAQQQAANEAAQQANSQAKPGEQGKSPGTKPGESQGQKPGESQSASKGGKVDAKDQLDQLKLPPMGLSGPPQGVAGADRGVVMSVDLSGIDVSKQAAGFYRLPPHIRDPLIQGLKESAPEGYQPIIDAYYRQLGAEGK